MFDTSLTSTMAAAPPRLRAAAMDIESTLPFPSPKFYKSPSCSSSSSSSRKTFPSTMREGVKRSPLQRVVTPPSISHPQQRRSMTPSSLMMLPNFVKHVRFQEQTDLISSPAPLDLCSAEQELWYTPRELHRFRSHARHVCRVLRSTEQAAAFVRHQICTLAHSSETRGLEQRSCFERQRRKYLTNQYIVKESSRRRHMANRYESLARDAMECTQWAAELAREEAKRDFERAYSTNEEEVSLPFPTVDEPPPQQPKAVLVEPMWIENEEEEHEMIAEPRPARTAAASGSPKRHLVPHDLPDECPARKRRPVSPPETFYAHI